jgi:hypothetical protein
MNNANKAYHTVRTMHEVVGPHKGKNLNISRRNVATSRLAELLGIGGMIARSRTAEVIDLSKRTTKDGLTTRGNVMEVAPGVEAGKISVGERQPAEMMTPHFARQSVILQIFDALCGQVDRHENNFFVQLDKEGRIDSLVGIDNDMAFGVYEELNSRGFQRDLFKFVNTDGTVRPLDFTVTGLALPYYDREFVQRIIELEPGIVRFMLADLLEATEIDALLSRLDKMQANFRTYMADKETQGRFLAPDKWSEADLKKLYAVRSYYWYILFDMETRKSRQ